MNSSAVNPAGAPGGGNKKTDWGGEHLGAKPNFPEPVKQFVSWQKNDNKKKELSEDECSTIIVKEQFNEDKKIKKIAETALKNQKVQNDFKRIKKRLEARTKPTQIGRRSTSLPGSGKAH